MQKQTITLVASALLVVGVLVRIIPHTPNATPLVAIALFSSYHLGKRWALLLPLLALFISDCTIGFYDWKLMVSVYGSFFLIGGLSAYTGARKNPLLLAITLISSSLLFFLITNASVWLFSPWYEKSFAGLLYAYELGIPFYRSMLLGDIFYSGLFFGVFAMVRASTRVLTPRRPMFVIAYKK